MNNSYNSLIIIIILHRGGDRVKVKGPPCEKEKKVK